MKSGTQNHIKTRRLMRLLNVPMYRAVGILETIWLMAQECCDEGNLGKYADQEIADYLGWEGDADTLLAALREAGWLDHDPRQRLVIHDWLDHCPDYIKERLRKRRWRQAKDQLAATCDGRGRDTAGTEAGPAGDEPPPVPSFSYPTAPHPAQAIFSAAEPTAAPPEAAAIQTVKDSDDEAPCSTSSPNLAEAPVPRATAAAGRTSLRQYPPQFAAFWEAYPARDGRKRGRERTLALWKGLRVADRELLLTAARHYAASRQVQDGFVRDPERFLKALWWRDWIAPETPGAHPHASPTPARIGPGQRYRPPNAG